MQINLISIGQKFGEWTVIEDLGIRVVKMKLEKRQGKIYPDRAQFCLVKCKCGFKREYDARKLRYKRTSSCPKCSKGSTKHGMCHTVENKCYRSMKRRCLNPKDRSYKYYGGRGIKVCDRWLESFENFFADMGKRPEGTHGKKPEYSIDRINVDGNYEPGNCRWATVTEQARNKTTALVRRKV